MLASSKRIVVTVVLLLLFPFVGAILQALLGGRVVSLPNAPFLSGRISQSLGGHTNGYPIINKDYTTSSHYFYNNSWVVISVKPLNTTLNGTLLVMQKQNGIYQTVLGPGGLFSSAQLAALPPNVATFLNGGGG